MIILIIVLYKLYSFKKHSEEFTDENEWLYSSFEKEAKRKIEETLFHYIYEYKDIGLNEYTSEYDYLFTFIKGFHNEYKFIGYKCYEEKRNEFFLLPSVETFQVAEYVLEITSQKGNNVLINFYEDYHYYSDGWYFYYKIPQLGIDSRNIDTYIKDYDF